MVFKSPRLSDLPNPLLTVVLSRTDFSSFADAQNSISSKPLVRWGCIGNRWKSTRVVQLFGIELRGRIPPEQPQNLFFLQHGNLSSITVFSNTVIRQKSRSAWTVDRMKASKYPLESWGGPLPFCYLTLDRTVPNFNSLTAACSQDW
jgi:hypothetical protein